eukprot:2804211-Pleurochrysis_carterae.AAC.1
MHRTVGRLRALLAERKTRCSLGTLAFIALYLTTVYSFRPSTASKHPSHSKVLLANAGIDTHSSSHRIAIARCAIDASQNRVH